MRWMAVLLVAALALAGCGGDGSGDGDAVLFCERLDRLADNDPFLAFGDTASPDDIEAAFGALIERAEALVEVAPRAARATAIDYAEAATELDSLLAGAAYVGTAVDAASYRRQQAAYADAARRLERHLEGEC